VVPLHAFGGARDLPIPAPLAIFGGAAALIVSFCVLILAWRSPRYDGARRERALPAGLARIIDSPAFRGVLRLLGLVFTVYVVWAMIAGKDLLTNPVFGVFYVLLWVGIVPASLAFGRFFRAVSPMRTLNVAFGFVTRSDPGKGLYAYPDRLGYWPAAIGLFAFVWQELVNPYAAFIGTNGLYPGVAFWLAIYASVMLIGCAVFGETWLSRADPFEVYSDLVAKLSPWARSEDGRLVWRSPLSNVSTVTPRAGLVAVVAILLGSTAFDSYKESQHWYRIVSDLGINVVTLNTLALLVFCGVVGVTFTVATMSTGVDRETTVRSTLPRLFGHSVAPIIVGYMTAHYLSYFVEYGQITLHQLSDPLGKGQDLLGMDSVPFNYWLSYHPTLLASIKVIAVVAGHIVGVVAAHDRALKLLPKKHQVTGQLGLLVIMVAYTFTGLYLLFGAK
jgi:hypothetical protein